VTVEIDYVFPPVNGLAQHSVDDVVVNGGADVPVGADVAWTKTLGQQSYVPIQSATAHVVIWYPDPAGPFPGDCQNTGL
jgi:hypothetical protein